ncbi:MAG: hypothetical protein ACR2ID_10475 [Chthoniobacterales bacterium]
MKRLWLAGVVFLGATAALRAQDFLDRLDERLTIAAFDNEVRARISGLLDLEFYHFQQPPPGLIDVAGHDLFNPRLTLFLDAQIGPRIYFFAQSRLDRGFDPRDQGPQLRLDEYALRVTPWEDGRLSLQAGKFATVVGQWVSRHLSWDNPFVNAPLVYENVTSLEDRAAPQLPFDGRLDDAKDEYIPVIWEPSYATGASAAGRLGKVEYAIELKNAALSSRPESWDATRVDFAHPTVSGRVGFRPDEAWNMGFSASDGAYFRPEAQATLPPGRGLGDYHQTLLVQDISFARHHLQLWAEFHEGRFNVPRLGEADTFGYFFEAKYRFAPQLTGAVRWNQQFFSDLPTGTGQEVPWSRDASRIEAAVSYRFTVHTQLKLQYYLTLQEDPGELSHTFAAQFTVRF